MQQVIAILIGGLVVGAVARLALPGRQPLGCVGTIAVGVVGGLIGGLLAGLLLGEAGAQPLLGFLFSVLGAVVVLLLLQAISRR